VMDLSKQPTSRKCWVRRRCFLLLGLCPLTSPKLSVLNDWQSCIPFFPVIRSFEEEGASACGCAYLMAAGHYTTLGMVSSGKKRQMRLGAEQLVLNQCRRRGPLLRGGAQGQDGERSHFALGQSLPFALRRVYADLEPAVSQRGRNERNEGTT
jgi:hypothetical protein